MAEIAGENFSDLTIDIDGIEYYGCTFKNCTLRYLGGPIPSFVNCDFKHTQFVFKGAASNTLELLRSMNFGGFKVVVDGVIQQIRDPKRPF